MKSVILRSSSGSFLAGALISPDSSRLSVSTPVQDTVTSERRSCCSSSGISLQLGVNKSRSSIRRVSSESDIDNFGGKKKSIKLGSKSFHYVIPEEEESTRPQSLTSTENRTSYDGDLLQSTIPIEDLGYPGGGVGNNWNSGSGGGGGGSSDFGNHINIGMYYEQILKSDPMNSLFLRNYAKYLHEVEKDLVKAEEYYGRAILANPGDGDGEVLALYGKLIWESYGDESRAKTYFDRSVHASPDDCMVLGSYAHFLWETEEEEDVGTSAVTAAAATVKAF